MKLSIVVPCYNEIDNIGKLDQELLPILQSLLGTEVVPEEICSSVEMVLVDDGSADGTLDALNRTFSERSLEAVTTQVIAHGHNRGLGAAIRSGMQHATGNVIITTDSDGTYRFGEISALLACLKPDVDIVTASPYHPNGGVDNVPRYRLILSQGSSLLYRIVVDWHIHTYTALFRAYRRRVIVQVMHTDDGFLGGTELMVKAMLAGFRVAEYPTVLHSRVHGVSKAKLARTIRAHLRFLARTLSDRLGGGIRTTPFGTIGEQQ